MPDTFDQMEFAAATGNAQQHVSISGRRPWGVLASVLGLRVQVWAACVIKEVTEMESKFVKMSAARNGLRALVAAAALVGAGAAMAPDASAQPAPPQNATEARIVVVGTGSVNVTPDLVLLRGGVTTRAKTVKEAVDTTSKTMAAITAAMLESGIAQKDIQTVRLSVQPVYAAPEPRAEQKLVGFSASNQLIVKIHDIDKVGPTLERLVAAGATDIGNVEFQVSEQSKELDKAREAAIADAKRKAELYARASGLTLGRVLWVTEDSPLAPPMPMLRGGYDVARQAVPISAGEDTLRTRVTVGFDVAR